LTFSIGKEHPALIRCRGWVMHRCFARVDAVTLTALLSRAASAGQPCRPSAAFKGDLRGGFVISKRSDAIEWALRYSFEALKLAVSFGSAWGMGAVKHRSHLARAPKTKLKPSVSQKWLRATLAGIIGFGNSKTVG
jgi:hypothetical protein